MNELGVGGGGKIIAHSPGSDCNSNLHPSSNSCYSSTSTQDIDFFQDNSDYQWFLDYNYRDGSTNHHTSILSLSEAYGGSGVVPGGDIRYYDALSKNMDANLAEADMESFRTEDIHALLTNLPTMCTDPLSQETISRHGESFASVSGSMLAKFDFDSSLSPRSSSQCDGGDSANSMSICKSELLFSPVKESPPLIGGGGNGGCGGANYSVDSLDCGDFLSEQDILLTCQANKENYTIAFEGSITMYSEDSDFHESEKSNSASGASSSRCSGELKMQLKNPKLLDTSMARSDSEGFTTWSNLKKRNSENQLKRHPSGNNNSEDANNQFSHTDNVLKSQSMPDLYKQKRDAANYDAKNQNFLLTEIDLTKKPVKVFDIQHQIRSCSGSGGSILSDMATSTDGTTSSTEQSKQQKPNLNLVKLFMKQKSISAEGMSLGMDQSGTSETHSINSSQLSESKSKGPQEQSKNEFFEDSLLVCQKPVETSIRTHELIVEEDEDVSRSESVEQLTESFSKLDLSDNSYHYMNPDITTSRNNNTSPLKKNINSSPSKKLAETQIRRTSTEVPAHLINRSIQTSCFVDSNLKNAPYKLNCNNTKEFVKVVEPSFLAKLKKDSELKKPVYVLYPNYVLPDLNFLQGKEDIAQILLMPHKPTLRTENVQKKRPFSCNDMEVLKQKGFSHVKDWDSLNFLLPTEFRKILADVPEVAKKIKNKEDMLKSFKPSFCNSPPVTRKARPVSCDCTKLMNRTNSLERCSSSSSVTTQPSSGYRGSSTILTDSQSSPNVNNLNPLFVYRYDSVTSSEASLMASERNRSITTMAPPYCKRSLSMNENNKAELAPPRPPLPKSILRRSLDTAKSRKIGDPCKRFSMFEAMEEEIDNDSQHKRFSMQEQYTRNKRTSETEDEGVDAGTSSSSLDEPQCQLVSSPRFKTELPLQNVSCDELVQLEEYLKMSGFSTSDAEDLDEQGMMQLRSHVTKFLALKINQDSNDQGDGRKIVSFAERINVTAINSETKPPNNSPDVSALLSQKHHNQIQVTNAAPMSEESKTFQTYSKQLCDLSQKRSLVSAVTCAVEKIVTHFSPASNQEELNALGDSSFNPACAKLALSTLCPALYAILSDGLKSSLDTTFGPISNSVWQVVEVSSHQGPLTKALNELVMRINSEDTITEGLVKFNAFIFGLLNVRSLDAWFSYLRTRESILKKHYEQDSLLILAHTGNASIRSLMDTLISTLEPLALLPFRFDLLFEYRQLHESLKRMDSYQQPLSPSHLKSPGYKISKQWSFSKLSNQSTSETEETSTATTVQNLSPKHSSRNSALPDVVNSPGRTKSISERPRSCIDPNFSKANFKLGEDHASIAKKRWSGISPSSKLYQAYERLAKEDDEDYTDSLETGSQKKKNEKEHNEEEDCSSIEEVTQIPEEGPDSLDSNLSDTKPINGRRFKKLQMKWEMLSGKESTSSNSPPQSPTHGNNKSKIPRPVTSPSRPSGIPVPVSMGTPKNIGKNTNKKSLTPTGTPSGKTIPGSSQMRSPNGNNLPKNITKGASVARTSRLDQLEHHEESPRHMTRPSSLPYKPASGNNRANKSLPPRRAVSSSVGRKNTTPKTQTSKKLFSSKHRKLKKNWNSFQNVHVQVRYVKTLSHRMPSESGHLTYNAGDRLKLILEVDDKWLLCCRGTQKGLVPRTDVITDNERF